MLIRSVIEKTHNSLVLHNKYSGYILLPYLHLILRALSAFPAGSALSLNNLRRGSVFLLENHLFYGLLLWTPTIDICQKDKLLSHRNELTVSTHIEPSPWLFLAAHPVTN